MEWKNLPPQAQKAILDGVRQVIHEYTTNHSLLIWSIIVLVFIFVVAVVVYGFIIRNRLTRLSSEHEKIRSEISLTNKAARTEDLNLLEKVHAAKKLSSQCDRELEEIIKEILQAMDQDNNNQIKILREKGLDLFSKEYVSSYANYVEIKALQFNDKKESSRIFINSSIYPWLKSAAQFLEVFNSPQITTTLKVSPFLLYRPYFSDINEFLDEYLDPSWADEFHKITQIKKSFDKWVND